MGCDCERQCHVTVNNNSCLGTLAELVVLIFLVCIAIILFVPKR